MLPTYLRFIQQADDDAKGPEVPNHILQIALHILLFEDVNKSLKNNNNNKNNKSEVTETNK